MTEVRTLTAEEEREWARVEGVDITSPEAPPKEEASRPEDGNQTAPPADAESDSND